MSRFPFRIDKESSPYLYLTASSGLYINITSGNYLYLPINPDARSDYALAGLQFWLMVPAPLDSDPIIQLLGDTNISIESVDDGSRDLLLYSGPAATVYKNGLETDVFAVYPGEWNAMNIVFDEPYALPSGGELRFGEGMAISNITAYLSQDNVSPNETQTFSSLTGASKIVTNDFGSVTAFANGVDLFTDVQWQTIERTAA